MDDHFRPIPGYPAYRVSRDGEVQTRWSRTIYRTLTETWLPLKPLPRRGYLTVNLGDGSGGKVARHIHRLVLEAFVGPCPPGMVCCHNDGDRTNNRVGNLRWDTYQENEADKARHGTKLTGNRHHAKLTEAEVVEIRRRRGEGARTAELADIYGVCRENVRAIVQRRTWKDVP